MLRDLAIRVNINEEKAVLQKYDPWNFQLRSLSKLFKSNLNNLTAVKFVKIGVVLTAHKHEDYKIFGNQIDVYYFCNFDKLYNVSIDINIRKEYLLSLVRDCLYKNSNLLGMHGQDIDDAYNKCLQDKLVYERFYKGKLFRSPSYQFYFGLLMIHDVNTYEVWEVLFNKKKEEITRRIGYKIEMIITT